MQSRTWVVIVVGVILLSAVAGLTLLTSGGESPAVPTPTPTTTPTPPIAPTPYHTPMPSPTPGPFLYTVQDGDTLAGIADAHGVSLEELVAANDLANPNLIHAGQVLVIPGLDAPAPPDLPTPATVPSAMPLLTPLPTLTVSGPPLVEIAGVLGAGDLETEVVRVRNRGGAVSLEGWTLSDAGGNRFTFPRLILFTGSEVNVHSGPGQPTPTHLYWGRTGPVWELGGLIRLLDRAEKVVDTYIVP